MNEVPAAAPAAPVPERRRELGCGNCGARLEVAEHLRTATCPYCDSPSVVERPPNPNRPEPRFAIGFTVTKERAQSLARTWLGRRRLFAPSSLRHARFEQMRGVYVPAYLYSSLARSRFHADIGEQYQEQETYTTQENGRTVRRTRTVTRTEWVPLQGTHETYAADIVVSASQGLPNAELEAVEPFDLRMLQRYAPSIISGWVAEEASTSPEQSMETARSEVRTRLSVLLSQFMPGDTHRNLEFHTELTQESADLCLLPLWILAVRWDEKRPPFRMLVNGQTGTLHGKPPLSYPKVVLAIVLLMSLLLGLGLWWSAAGGLR